MFVIARPATIIHANTIGTGLLRSGRP